MRLPQPAAPPRRSLRPAACRLLRLALLVSPCARACPCARPQSRPNIFDLEIKAPDVLYEAVVECAEQVVLPLGDAPST